MYSESQIVQDWSHHYWIGPSEYDEIIDEYELCCIVIYVFVMYTENGIDVEGAKMLGEALKYNATLTTLDLYSMKQLIFMICDAN